MIDNMISYAAMGTMESRNVPLKFAIKCFSEEQTNFMAEKIRIFSLVGKEMAIGEETFFSAARGEFEKIYQSLRKSNLLHGDALLIIRVFGRVFKLIY